MDADKKHVIIYTDGGCLPNPGVGGYGVVLIYGAHRKEASAGYQRTTNNRMEVMAAVKGLELLKHPCRVTIFSDSQYLVRAMMEGWARRWQKRNWTRSNKEKAANPDLWKKLIDLCTIHEVEFRWLKGHDGHAENERCDQLSMLALQQVDLLVDEGYTPSLAEGVLSANDIESLWGAGLPSALDAS